MSRSSRMPDRGDVDPTLWEDVGDGDRFDIRDRDAGHGETKRPRADLAQQTDNAGTNENPNPFRRIGVIAGKSTEFEPTSEPTQPVADHGGGDPCPLASDNGWVEQYDGEQ